MDDNCLQFQDIHERYPSKDPPKEVRDAVDERNRKNHLVYRAVRWVLTKNFHLNAAIPEKPQDFATAATKLPPADVTQFTAILGLMRADNWDNPTNGKTKASEDDLTYRGANEDTSFVIDRRFVDAVVEAVKEFTAASDLFNNVYTLMRDEATEGFGKPKSTAST